MKRHSVMAMAMVAILAVAGNRLVARQGAMQGSMQGSMQSPMQGSMSDHAAVEKALMANENAINEAFAKRDVAKMKSFIADDAMSLDMSGTMTVADLYKQLPTMDMKVTEQQASNFKFVWADANTVIVSYTWTGKGMAMGQPMPSPVYASTVWTKRGAKWTAVFHQESVAAPPMKK